MYETGGKATMYLHEVLEMEGDNGNGFRIGLDLYPIFDESYRDSLNRKIIAHYWNREIGMETISMFKFALMRRMAEIMPYWNQIYKTTLHEIDPFSTVSLTTARDDATTEDTNATNTTGGKATTTTGGRTVNSDFPQSALSGNADYASTGADAKSTAETDQNSTGTTTGKNTAKVTGSSTTSGYQGHQADMLSKVRAAVLNVDMLVIGGAAGQPGLDDLFLGVYGTGEEMLSGNFYGIGYGGMLGLGMGYL